MSNLWAAILCAGCAVALALVWLAWTVCIYHRAVSRKLEDQS